jgi:hypothetical protein
MRIAVIADDLTGALDTGVQFTQWGFTAQLTDTPEHSVAEVTIVNTDTRNKTSEIAYHITYNVAEKLDQHDIIYKKIDSTLRGNPGPELQAILDATGETNAILTPAHPPTQRRVKDGHLYIADRPITETDYIHEYRKKTSYIPEILDLEQIVHTLKTPENIPPKSIAIVDSETPHSGDGGLFGDEEERIITPAIEKARKEGLDVDGPVPPDTVFGKAAGGQYDIVVALYHDQGHIPVKLLGMKYDEAAGEWTSIRGVNITLGLKFIRTSVDHGTAYGKAGRKEGTANPDSLKEAIQYAVQMAEAQKKQ